MTNSEPLHEDKRQGQEEQAVQRMRHLIEEGLASGPAEARSTDDLSELRAIAAAIRE